jgi:putative FmdB family regulatory protein
MPIFEYTCGSCSKDFELLVRSDTRVACPECASEKVTKKLSVFASHIGRPSHTEPACHTGGQGCDLGKCGSGFCGMD